MNKPNFISDSVSSDSNDMAAEETVDRTYHARFSWVGQLDTKDSRNLVPGKRRLF